MARQKDEKQCHSMYILAFKYLTLLFYFSKQNFINQFNHFHGKNVDKKLKVNYQGGCACLRRIVLGSGLSSIFRVVFFNLLKCIELLCLFPLHMQEWKEYFPCLNKLGQSSTYREFYELIRKKTWTKTVCKCYLKQEDLNYVMKGSRNVYLRGKCIMSNGNTVPLTAPLNKELFHICVLFPTNTGCSTNHCVTKYEPPQQLQQVFACWQPESAQPVSGEPRVRGPRVVQGVVGWGAGGAW